MVKIRRLSRGILLFAQAMVAAGHSREDAQGIFEISAGHLSHLLGGTRGIGLTIANKIKATYADRGHDVPTEAWEVEASPAESLLILETIKKIRKAARKAAPTASPSTPEAA